MATALPPLNVALTQQLKNTRDFQLEEQEPTTPLTATPSPPRTTFDHLPAEVLSYIVRLVYLESIPRSHHRNLDLHGLPSTYSDGRRISSPYSSVQTTLWALCLTSKKLFAHARPLLYRRINVTLPYSFILLIRTLGAAALATAYEQFQLTGKLNQDPHDPNSFTSIVAAAGFARVLGSSLLITGPTQSQSQAQSSANASATQPRRVASLTGVETEEDELDLVWRPDPLGDPNAPTTRWTVSLHPLGGDTDALQRCVRVVDFSMFRTQGMRRTVGEGIENRFVTPSRLLALLTAAPDLASFGACQTMDSSLSLEVLEALLFRGGKIRRPARLRGVSVERRKKGEQLSLAAIDFTDCVSPIFERAMEAFVNRHLRRLNPRTTDTVHEQDEDHYSSAAERTTESETDDQSDVASSYFDDEEDEPRGRTGGRGRSSSNRGGFQPTPSMAAASSVGSRSRTRSLSMHRPAPSTSKTSRFPSIQRLSLGGITWRLDLLSPLVQAFPNLTHLDLSRTKTDARLLDALAASPTLHLESLSLASCRNLTSDAIRRLLVDSPVTATLIELSLEGSLLFPTALERPDLETIVSKAPCFRAGHFRYLDIGGCGMDDALLDLFAPQPCLLDLGMGASPGISLSGVSKFLQDKAPNVQVLELTDSCYDTSKLSGVSALDLSTMLIGPCCTTPPLPLSMQLLAMGFASPSLTEEGLPPQNEAIPREPTNLRVIGLNGPSLRSIRDGIGAWKVIWGAGKRGWVVDTSAGPNPEARDSDLEVDTDNYPPTPPEEAESATMDVQYPSYPIGVSDWQDGEVRGRSLMDVDHGEGRGSSGSGSRSRGRDPNATMIAVPHLSSSSSPSPLRRGRRPSMRRTGYEPETPPASRHASLSPTRFRRSIGVATGAGVGTGVGVGTPVPGPSSMRRTLSTSRAPQVNTNSRSRSRSQVRGSFSPPFSGVGTPLATHPAGGPLGGVFAGAGPGPSTPRAPSSSSSSRVPLTRSDTLTRSSVLHEREEELHRDADSMSISARGDDDESNADSEEQEQEQEPVKLKPRFEVIRNLAASHPRRIALEALAQRGGHVGAEVGWHSRKMEVLLGFGLLGRERGSYAFAAYCQR